jgi:hypothetical protein
VSGRVSGCDAEEHCDVIVFANDQRLWSLPASRYVMRASTQAGVYKAALPAGSYRIAAIKNVPDGAEGDPRFLAELAKSTQSRSISVKGGQSGTLDVRAGSN